MYQYTIDLKDNNCIKLRKKHFTFYLLKFPFTELKNIKIDNNFVVYILYEETNNIIYVGKSINGLKNRQLSHANKLPSGSQWTDCLILTEIPDNSDLDDGIIGYLEDQIYRKFKAANKYNVSTDKTSNDTVSPDKKEELNPQLEEIYDMLYILGFNLKIVKATEFVEEVTKNDTEISKLTGRKKLVELFKILLEKYTVKELLEKIDKTDYGKNKRKLCSQINCWDKKYKSSIKELKDKEDNILFLFVGYSNKKINKIYDAIKNI